MGVAMYGKAPTTGLMASPLVPWVLPGMLMLWPESAQVCRASRTSPAFEE